MFPCLRSFMLLFTLALLVGCFDSKSNGPQATVLGKIPDHLEFALPTEAKNENIDAATLSLFKERFEPDVTFVNLAAVTEWVFLTDKYGVPHAQLPFGESAFRASPPNWSSPPSYFGTVFNEVSVMRDNCQMTGKWVNTPDSVKVIPNSSRAHFDYHGDKCPLAGSSSDFSGRFDFQSGADSYEGTADYHKKFHIEYRPTSGQSTDSGTVQDVSYDWHGTIVSGPDQEKTYFQGEFHQYVVDRSTQIDCTFSTLETIPNRAPFSVRDGVLYCTLEVRGFADQNKYHLSVHQKLVGPDQWETEIWLGNRKFSAVEFVSAFDWNFALWGAS